MFQYDTVTVLDGSRLIDGESYERTYRTCEGRGLKPGHYLVVWDDRAGTRAFDDRAVYCGPHETAERVHAILAGYLNLHSRAGSGPVVRADVAACV